MTEADFKELIEEYLENSIKLSEEPCRELGEAMRYSLLAGGKRIRPILTMEFCTLSGGKVEDALPAACAVEMIHTYSLIHDDLPCMDDDDLRRGKPTNHNVYGECTATLAGDALQAKAFSVLLNSGLDNAAKAKCGAILADAAGYTGMCGGQYLDMKAENNVLTAEELTRLNLLKTGKIIMAACMMGVVCAGGSDQMLESARCFGENLGLAFQIRDDVLDVVSTREELGKPIGSDAAENKNTYMAILGEAKCNEYIDVYTYKAKAALRGVFRDTEYLESFADSLALRRN